MLLTKDNKAMFDKMVEHHDNGGDVLIVLGGRTSPRLGLLRGRHGRTKCVWQDNETGDVRTVGIGWVTEMQKLPKGWGGTKDALESIYNDPNTVMIDHA